jgi:calcineurin-like phosphoesterase family protein
MNTYLISDTHLKHENMKTYCLRPSNFTELIHRNIMNTVQPGDTLIHLGDVGINKAEDWEWMVRLWPGRKILIRGNHDRTHSNTWWMSHGFDFSCESLVLRDILLTHEPYRVLSEHEILPSGCRLNVHGHLHNIWDGFQSEDRAARDKEFLGDDYLKRLKHPWQRLFSVEYTKYMPVEFNKFVDNVDNRYQSVGPTRPNTRIVNHY